MCVFEKIMNSVTYKKLDNTMHRERENIATLRDFKRSTKCRNGISDLGYRKIYVHTRNLSSVYDSKCDSNKDRSNIQKCIAAPSRNAHSYSPLL